MDAPVPSDSSVPAFDPCSLPALPWEYGWEPPPVDDCDDSDAGEYQDVGSHECLGWGVA